MEPFRVGFLYSWSRGVSCLVQLARRPGASWVCFSFRPPPHPPPSAFSCHCEQKFSVARMAVVFKMVGATRGFWKTFKVRNLILVPSPHPPLARERGPVALSGVS